MIALAAVTITALIVVGVVVIVMSRRRGDRTRFSSDVTRDRPGDVTRDRPGDVPGEQDGKPGPDGR